MTPPFLERQRRILEICDEALDRPADERDVYLGRVCGSDAALRQAVDQLLESASFPLLDQVSESPIPLAKPVSRVLRSGRSRSAAAELPERVGPYRITGKIGAGGLGRVLAAWDERLDRSVALKQILPAAAQKPRARERFRREARATAGLDHPAVVKVFDVLEDEDDWIVMELVEGLSLAQLLKDGPLDVGLAVQLGRQVAAGLAAAHGNGVIHRDLKTENVMVTPPGNAKILDFGMVKFDSAFEPSLSPAGDQGGETLSVTGQVLGTPRAMSPEQAGGHEVDARTDLFSFGVLMYEMTTARSPFQAGSLYATLHRVMTHQQPGVRQLNPRVPVALSGLVDRWLAKEPEERGHAMDAGASLAALAEEMPAEAGSARVATVFLTELDTSSDEAGRARALLERHGGEEIRQFDNTGGGSGLFFFDHPSAAIDGALELRARSAIHLGEVIVDPGAPSGPAVAGGAVARVEQLGP